MDLEGVIRVVEGGLDIDVSDWIGSWASSQNSTYPNPRPCGIMMNLRCLLAEAWRCTQSGGSMMTEWFSKVSSSTVGEVRLPVK